MQSDIEYWNAIYQKIADELGIPLQTYVTLVVMGIDPEKWARENKEHFASGGASRLGDLIPGPTP